MCLTTALSFRFFFLSFLASYEFWKSKALSPQGSALVWIRRLLRYAGSHKVETENND